MITKGKPTVRKGIKESPAGRRGVVRLTESELERAELILNAKAISDRLQKMAEDLAKIEADDLMPLIDPMRTAFGQQVADQFNRVVTEKSRAAMEAIKSAKDGVGIEISRLESSMGGKGTSDMAMDLPAPEPEMPAAPAGGEPSEPSLDDVEDRGDDDIQIDKGGKKDPFADLFSDDDSDMASNAAGRAKKESAKPRGSIVREGALVHALRRSGDPDLLILSRFRMRLREGLSAEKAVRFTAHEAAVDVSDVVQIVKEAAGRRDAKRVLEGKVPPQFLKHTKKKKDGKSKDHDGIDDDGDGTPDWADKKPGKKDSAKKPDADGDGVPNWADKNPFKKGDKDKDRKVAEAKKMKDDPCWKGHEMVGKKMKDGREVPNCVPTKESKGAGKSTLPFAQAAGNGRLRETITPQRQAELQAMGYAVNQSGRGFYWAKPEPGKTTNIEQQNTASNDEKTAWFHLDQHVKTAARMQTANNGKPNIIKPVGPKPPNPPNKPGVMNANAPASNVPSAMNEREMQPSVIHTERGKIGEFSVREDGGRYSVYRHTPGGGIFQRAANLSRSEAIKAARLMAGGLTEDAAVTETDRKPARPPENGGPSRREREAIFGRISPPPPNDGTWMTIFNDIVKNVTLLGEPKTDPYNNANHENDWARDVARHQARAKLVVNDYEIMVETTGNAIYGFAEDMGRDQKASITYGVGEGRLDRVAFITKVRQWVQAAKRGEPLKD